MDFGSDKISTLFGKLFFPTLAGMLSLCAVTAADGIFIGHGIGGDGIAAVNICVPPLMFFTGFGLMAGIGGSVIASIALSKGKIKRARFNLTQSMIFVTAVMMFFVALIMLFPEKTARLLGASDHLLKMVVDYLLWFVPGLIFQMWGAVALFYIRLDGAPKLAMWWQRRSRRVKRGVGLAVYFPVRVGCHGGRRSLRLCPWLRAERRQ